MGMDLNAGEKRRIVLGDKEYRPPEDAAARTGTEQKGGGIVFNGGPYYDPEAMPPGMRINYVETMRKAGMGAKGVFPRRREIKLPGRIAVILLLLAAFALLKFF